jgi:hypothetical protein
MLLLQSLHLGVYRGFGKTRRLTENFGIRALWEVPSLNVSHILSVARVCIPSSLALAHALVEQACCVLHLLSKKKKKAS